MKALDLNTFIKVRVYSPSPIPWCLIAGVPGTQKAPNNDGLNEWTGGPPWTPGNANIPYIWLWNVFWEVTPEFESMLRKAAWRGRRKLPPSCWPLDQFYLATCICFLTASEYF